MVKSLVLLNLFQIYKILIIKIKYGKHKRKIIKCQTFLLNILKVSCYISLICTSGFVLIVET